MVSKSAIRAAQTWPLLAWAAKHQQILTYDDIHKLTGMATPGVGTISLGPIKRYCKKNGYPPLTVLVVNQETGIPGEGLDDAFGSPPNSTPPEAQMEVFRFAWMDKGAPSVEDLEKHVEANL